MIGKSSEIIILGHQRDIFERKSQEIGQKNILLDRAKTIF
jgi:hypothetical protein